MKTTDNQNEMFVVVDDQDRVLGYRTRYDCHHDKTLIHRTAGVLVFHGKKFLLQKRSLTKDLQPGKWGISAAGHVTKGETYESTVVREMAEEIGLRDISIKFVKTFIERGTQETEISALYFAKSHGPFILNPQEVSEVRFFTLEELKKCLFDGSVELTECATETLKQIHFL